MKPRQVKPLEVAELEALTTVRLLAYLRRLQECESSLDESDWTPEEIAEASGIVFKTSPEWKRQYDAVKAVLAKRPHVDRKR
jgi:hypothetical protein